jgi:hypothetical protein
MTLYKENNFELQFKFVYISSAILSVNLFPCLLQPALKVSWSM